MIKIVIFVVFPLKQVPAHFIPPVHLTPTTASGDEDINLRFVGFRSAVQRCELVGDKVCLELCVVMYREHRRLLKQ